MFVLISFTKNSLPDETNCKYFRFNKILEPLIITTIHRLLIYLIFISDVLSIRTSNPPEILS